ncbi:MAG: response regulator transcription factor [Chloroflexota bacterium]
MGSLLTIAAYSNQPIASIRAAHYDRGIEDSKLNRGGWVNILIIGEDVRSLNIIALILRQEGYTVESIIDHAQAEQTWADFATDVLILDHDTIDSALLRLIETIRGKSTIAIMLLANPWPEHDVINAYEAGIDDFLAKPYSYQMLLAHINARIRRTRVIQNTVVPNLVAADLSLDPERHTVTLPDQQVRQLTNLEFRLLYSLMLNRGHVLTAEMIIEKVWGYTGEGDRNLLKSLISRLRAKIEPSPREPKLITTVPGIGYTFDPTDNELP